MYRKRPTIEEIALTLRRSEGRLTSTAHSLLSGRS
ncbi:hypothetical protein GMJLKIPL_1807 [Methylobacterium isbiliense]|uniref:Uncharacterized protein n=1 Tax=Methylobacterium isbiliense TaxID=315478 RepID=A0ABQ4SBR1_9HYPH|nr:hypothetical protein GMJLKIPL_1807 [Methylobacterium isbiliense]